jgi:ATP-dependent RNA helicase DDX55/SPB4
VVTTGCERQCAVYQRAATIFSVWLATVKLTAHTYFLVLVLFSSSFSTIFQEHKCEFIFRFGSLNVSGLANAYALLRLPKIPELRKGGALVAKHQEKFVPDMTVKTEDVPYLDKMRERARRKRLEVSKEAAAAAAKLEATQKQEHEAERRGMSGAEKKKAKAMELALAANPHWSEDGPRKRKGKHEQMMEEWDDLAKEERLFKKLRKGAITQKQYDAQLKGKGRDEEEEEEEGEDDDDEEEDGGSSDGGDDGGGLC